MKFNMLTPLPVKCRQSCASCAVACERKWFLKYRLGVVLRGGSYKEAADLGTIFHRFMLEGAEGEGKVLAWVNEWRLRLHKQISAGEDLDGNLARTSNKLSELYNIAEAMARIFREKYPQPEWFKTIGREIKHEFTYEGVLLSGTLDKLLLDTRTNNVWIRDYKSTGRALMAIFAGAPWRVQGRIYRLLAEDYLFHSVPDLGKTTVTEEQLEKAVAPFLSMDQKTLNSIVPVNVQGFILDGIKKPGIKLCRTDIANAKKWNVSEAEAYLRRVKEWYKETEGKDDAPVMKSMGVMYTEARVTPELEKVLSMFRKYQADVTLDPMAYSRDPSGRECFAWERQCEYYDLCMRDPKNWDDLFEKKYTFKKEETEE